LITSHFVKEKKIIIGRFSGPFGIQGWVHLISYTDPQSNVFRYPHWKIQKNNLWQPIQREIKKPHGSGWIVKIKNCDDRDQAMLLKGFEIAIDRTDLPNTTDQEYYWEDLIGLKVMDLSGKNLGIIDYLFETGANDVIAVKLNNQKHFIPYLKQVIKSVDLEKKTMMVDWEII